MSDFIKLVYTYCTDLVINLANIFGLSYYEINAFLFCFLYPVLILLLVIVYFIQKRRLKKINQNFTSSPFIPKG